MAALLQFPHQRGTHHSSVSSYVNGGVEVDVRHGVKLRLERQVRGARAKRKPSPTQVKASTKLAINPPGTTASQACWVVSRWACSLTMLPQEGMGIWAPTPRKLKPASIKMAEAKLAAQTTTNGPRALGSM